MNLNKKSSYKDNNDEISYEKLHRKFYFPEIQYKKIPIFNKLFCLFDFKNNQLILFSVLPV
jgi:hypothetical protein